jgi:hypothetical protein
MKKLVLSSIFILLFCRVAGATSIETGYFSDRELSASVLSLNLDSFHVDTAYGLTLNADLSGKNYGLESVVARYMEYDNGRLGIRFAPIEDMSFGYGLLLNDLSTAYAQPVFLTNKQSGLRIYYDADSFVLEALGTFSHLYGVRMRNIRLLNLNMGLEYVSDDGAATREGYGSRLFGGYVELPVTDVISLFAEGGNSSNGGEGSMAGISANYDLIFAFAKVTAASVSMNNKFIPGYFTAGYETDPIDLVSLEADSAQRYGSMFDFNVGVLGFVAIDYCSENYKDGGSANSESFLISPLDRLNITGFIKELSFTDFRPIRGKDSNLIGGTMDYKFLNGVYASLNYEKSLANEELDLESDPLKPVETWYFKLGCQF